MPTNENKAAKLARNIIDHWDVILWRERPELRAHEVLRRWLMEEVTRFAGDDQETYAFVLFEVVSQLAEQARFDDAFRLIRWIVDRYGTDADTELAARVIESATDYCAQLASAGHGEVAVSTLRYMAKLSQRDGPVLVERAVCRALIQAARLLNSVVSAKPIPRWMVANAWLKIVRRWEASQDQELRMRVAQAMLNHGLTLLAGRPEKAAKAFSEVLERFDVRNGHAQDQGEEIRKFVTIARHAASILPKLQIPPAELNTSYMKAQQLHPEWSNSLSQVLAWEAAMREVIAAAKKIHQKSTVMVQTWACTGVPFILVLRNFDLIESSHVSDHPQRNRHQSAGFVRFLGLNDPMFDETLDRTSYGLHDSMTASDPFLDALRRHNPNVIQVASTVAPHLEAYQNAVQLYLRSDAWFRIVEQLVGLAEAIVIRAMHLSPGVRQELRLVRDLGRMDDTVILVPPNKETMVPIMNLLAETYLDLHLQDAEPLTPHNSALGGFRRCKRRGLPLPCNGKTRVCRRARGGQIVRSDQVELKDLTRCQAFARMFTRLAQIESLSELERIERMTARLRQRGAR
jgi:hypothetical protein